MIITPVATLQQALVMPVQDQDFHEVIQSEGRGAVSVLRHGDGTGMLHVYKDAHTTLVGFGRNADGGVTFFPAHRRPTVGMVIPVPVHPVHVEISPFADTGAQVFTLSEISPTAINVLAQIGPMELVAAGEAETLLRASRFGYVEAGAERGNRERTESTNPSTISLLLRARLEALGSFLIAVTQTGAMTEEFREFINDDMLGNLTQEGRENPKAVADRMADAIASFKVEGEAAKNQEIVVAALRSLQFKEGDVFNPTDPFGTLVEYQVGMGTLGQALGRQAEADWKAFLHKEAEIITGASDDQLRGYLLGTLTLDQIASTNVG